MTSDELANQIKHLVNRAEADADNELGTRQEILEHLIRGIRKTLTGPPEERYATVILFKPSGKYYTEESWRIPTRIKDHSPMRGNYVRGPIGPFDMRHSPDFRRIDGGAVLVESQEPWGYPHLFPAEG